MAIDKDDVKVGRAVVYTPWEGCDVRQKELGYIVSASKKYIFVNYGTIKNPRVQATDPKDLEYLTKGGDG